VGISLRVGSSDKAELGSALKAGREALEEGLEDETGKVSLVKLYIEGEEPNLKAGRKWVLSLRVGSSDKLNLVQLSKLAGKHLKRGWRIKQGRFPSLNYT
jgi:hypothetical protein